ncbi:MAG: hypothetical protein H6724_10785 [Sandaracinus sp.]|nr:hypothetical protein [Sandaracinus sp.]MCB9619919.1 hypothetical protein [Sandaracinus sp.]MCB9624938.1 hypothetical protein [Sandaracinus sp.]
MSARRELGWQALLALLGLGVAVAATRDEVRVPAAGETVVVDCARVDEVRLASPSRDVRVHRARGVVRVEVTRRVEGEEERLSFLGGADAEAYLDELAPLVARRDLGVLEGDALVEVGLDRASVERERTRWTLRCGSRNHRFVVGGRAYGTGDRYVREERSGAPVVLFEAARIRDLETAELRLVERRWHRFAQAEAERAVVTFGGVEHTMTQRNRRSHDAAWVDAAAPEERRSDYDRLMRALLGLAITRYPQEAPEVGAPLLEARFADARGRALGEMALFTRGEGADARWWVRSDATGGFAEVLPSTGAAVLRAAERLATP